MLNNNILEIIQFYTLNNAMSIIIYTDAASNKEMYFQESASPFMDGIIAFHDSLMFFLIVIGFYVTNILIYIIYYYSDFNLGYYVFEFTISNDKIKNTTIKFLNDKNINITSNILKTNFTSIFNIINYIKNFIQVYFINIFLKNGTSLKLSLYCKEKKIQILRLINNILKAYNLNYVEPNIIFFKDKYQITHNTKLEVIWTIVPALILMLIAGPSFALLYATDVDTFFKPYITLKVIGHQWYWEYQYNFGQTKNFIVKNGWSHEKVFKPRNWFNSYMLSEDSLDNGALRLLEVDNRTIVPIKTQVRFIVTSQDVLHSWCIPSLGIKIDACPGRLNEIPLFLKRGGVFYGQCSEICGINHAFMPIVIQGVDIVSFVLTNEFNEYLS